LITINMPVQLSAKNEAENQRALLNAKVRVLQYGSASVRKALARFISHHDPQGTNIATFIELIKAMQLDT